EDRRADQEENEEWLRQGRAHLRRAYSRRRTNPHGTAAARPTAIRGPARQRRAAPRDKLLS
ncbi:MAG TPA: hypothetical protein VOA80_11185, partial [Thermoanaerobaculia bacterium]|nr:hypothetical protein [Thermoanaerobaculia bacterium]